MFGHKKWFCAGNKKKSKLLRNNIWKITIYITNMYQLKMGITPFNNTALKLYLKYFFVYKPQTF